MNRREILTALPIALVASQTAAATEAPRALSARGEVNLTAFARLLAYVHFFHPTDEAAATDWNALAVSNVEAVEAARSPAELVERLDAVFRPIAPTLQLYATSTPPAARPDAPPAAGTLVMWKHWGVALTSPSTYHAARVAVADGRPKVLPLTLGAGVSALMPTTAYAEPAAFEAPTMAAAATAAHAYSADERRVHLAAVILTWGVLHHFYPYFDTAGDWDAALSEGLRSAARDPDGQAFRLTLARMVATLRDGHGNVYYRSAEKGLPSGWSWSEDQLVSTALPDDAKDLAAGAVVTRIDGVDVRQRLAALDPEICAATPQWLRFKSLQRLQERPDGTTAVLQGETPDGRPFTASLAAAPWKTVYALASKSAVANFSEPRPGVVYVDLARVTDDDLRTRMAQLAAARGIVLDDRGYPSGPARMLLYHLSDRTLHSARFEKPIVTEPDGRNVVFDGEGSWVMAPLEPRFTGRLVLLTSGGSISYAESWAGTFEGERLGPIVGGPTAGTNGNINQLWLPGGYLVLFTGMRVRKQDGSRHHGVGIIPTVPISQTLAGFRAGRDDVLERGAALAAGDA